MTAVRFFFLLPLCWMEPLVVDVGKQALSAVALIIAQVQTFSAALFCGCGVLNNSEVESVLYHTQYFVFTPVVCRYQLLTAAVKNMGAVFNCAF